MNLFQLKNLEQRKIVFDKNLFQDFFITKLGYVFVDCKLNEDEYKFETKQREQFDTFCIHNKNVNVEIITFESISDEDKEFGIDSIRLWVFRILAKSNNQNIELKIDFENNFNKDINVNAGGGQGYEYYTFNDDLHSLSIGTESLDDGLDIRVEENNFLTNQIYNQIKDKDIYGKNPNNHFIISLSDLPLNEIIQLHFVMAYSDKYLGDDDYTAPSTCQNATYVLNNKGIK